MTENRLNHKLDTTKLKTIKDVRNIFDTLELVASFSEDNEKYEMAKEYFTIPYKHPEVIGFIPRKSLEEIQKECEDKFDELLVKTKRKFALSKESAEYYYNQKFQKIEKNFEYLKEWGHLPRFTIGTDILTNSTISNSCSFVIKQGNKHEGYYTINNGTYRFYMMKKPNMIFRFFVSRCLGLKWIDEK